ncbi:MAG: hypothetical protein IPN70_02755 [Candidatus Moraniibacteriota bacterium]|nr:MAG: hypothetical protein IPN70_02755 [Candidatus Moranbacteria bacterium]
MSKFNAFLNKVSQGRLSKNKEFSPERTIDRDAMEIYSWWKHTYVYIRKNKIRAWQVVFLLAFIAGIIVTTLWLITIRIENKSDATDGGKEISMDIIKYKGCIADGVLSGYGDDTDNSILLLERSECQYLHRAVETWTAHPNFTLVEENLKKFKREDFIFGMFLAEALDPRLEYKDDNKKFVFSKMCKEGSEGFWGPDTCKADFSKKEYRKYLDHITQRAMDLGIQSFLFGQIMFQDDKINTDSYAYDIVSDMRDYAQKTGKKIIIGAQTNTITNESYLRMFDYIEGGVGINTVGDIENGPCFSFQGNDQFKNWCWALLWNERYASRANNVLLHLDWRGDKTDDMSIFARMDQNVRKKTLRNLYNFFREKEMGFLLPMLAVVAKDNNGGCYGPKENFYSPDNNLGCQDENAINNILALREDEEFILVNKEVIPENKEVQTNDAVFISQIVPQEMIAGQKYTISLSLKNSGKASWTNTEKYALGSQSPQDNNLWGGRIFLTPEEVVAPGQTKHFIFIVTAPKESGEYMFQWRMVQEFKEWFGNFTTKTPIRVINLS